LLISSSFGQLAKPITDHPHGSDRCDLLREGSGKASAQNFKKDDHLECYPMAERNALINHSQYIYTKVDQLSTPTSFVLDSDGKFDRLTCKQVVYNVVYNIDRSKRAFLLGSPFKNESNFSQNCYSYNSYESVNLKSRIESDGSLDYSIDIKCYTYQARKISGFGCSLPQMMTNSPIPVTTLMTGKPSQVSGWLIEDTVRISTFYASKRDDIYA